MILCHTFYLLLPVIAVGLMYQELIVFYLFYVLYSIEAWIAGSFMFLLWYNMTPWSLRSTTLLEVAITDPEELFCWECSKQTLLSFLAEGQFKY